MKAPIADNLLGGRANLLKGTGYVADAEPEEEEGAVPSSALREEERALFAPSSASSSSSSLAPKVWKVDGA